MSQFNGYIPAAFGTYVKYISRRIDEKYWPSINHHFRDKTSGIMTCFGEKVIQSSKWDSNVEAYKKDLKDLSEHELSKGIPHYIDSGGYQVLTGKLDLDGVEYLSDNYYKMLVEQNDLYSKAFILDLPLNDNCFNSYDDIYYHNSKSYRRAAELPQEVRDKILYVSHFATPENTEIFDRIFNEVDAINTFNHFAIGGIANRESRIKHYISYFTIPVVYYLKKALDNNKTSLHLHFLGADALAAVLFYKLVEIIAKEKHGIDLRITYDSAVMWPLLKGKKFRCIDDDKLYQLNFFGRDVDKNYGRTETTEQKIKRIVNRFNDQIGLRHYNDEDVIYDSDDKMNWEMEVNFMIQHAGFMNQVSELFNRKISEAYRYKETDIFKFSELMHDIVKNSNFGKYGRIQKMLHSNIPVITTIIENLDYNKTNYMLKQHSSNSEVFTTKPLTV